MLVTSTALQAALIEVERHVARLGWDQPARLFALVPTSQLLAAEPGLASQLEQVPTDGFTSIEQEDFHAGADLARTLAQIGWPASVAGCTLAVERSFLPAEAESDLPDDPRAAAEVVSTHSQRLDLRVVVGVTRAGDRHGVARVRGQSGELVGGADLVPALAEALAHTLE